MVQRRATSSHNSMYKINEGSRGEMKEDQKLHARFDFALNLAEEERKRENKEERRDEKKEESN